MGCFIRTLGLLLVVIVTSQALQVELPGLGVIDGSTTISFYNLKTIYQYKGIPYAQPPIGPLRFKKPVKFNTPWTDVRNMSLFGPICPQNTEGPLKNVIQDEDCLTLNVYTKKIDGGGNGTGLPVMFYIHGGSFRVGSARGVTPEYLLDEQVVLVSVQYRLGPLGFLSLKTEDIPGNQGMLDVVLALEWVRDNIELFGGDPSRVTVFGQSAGAAAVTSLLFSPLAKDLFHGVIAQSGAVVGTWATDADPVTHAKEIAALASCTDSNEAALATCLRAASVQEILDAHTDFLIKDIDEGGRAVGGNHLVWGEAGNESFLPDDPVVMLRKGNYYHLPMMAGITKHEGSWFLWNVYDLFVKDMNNTDEQMKDFMERNMTKLVLDYGGIHDVTGYVDGFMRDKYFKKEEVGDFDKMVPGLIDIIGVSLLKASTFTFTTHMSRQAPCFFYSFNFIGRHTTFNDWGMTDPPFTGGVAHSDDLFYLFPLGKHESLDGREASVVRTMVELWTSFAIDSVPSTPKVTWPPLSTYAGPYLKIDVEPRVYDDFIEEEYMIAVKEGLLQLSASTTITVSIVTILAALSTHL